MSSQVETKISRHCLNMMIMDFFSELTRSGAVISKTLHSVGAEIIVPLGEGIKKNFLKEVRNSSYWNQFINWIDKKRTGKKIAMIHETTSFVDSRLKEVLLRAIKVDVEERVQKSGCYRNDGMLDDVSAEKG